MAVSLVTVCIQLLVIHCAFPHSTVAASNVTTEHPHNATVVPVTTEHPHNATVVPVYTTRKPVTHPFYTTEGPTKKPSCHRNESCQNYGSCIGFNCSCITGFYGDSCQYKHSWASRVCVGRSNYTVRSMNGSLLENGSSSTVFQLCHNGSQTCANREIYYTVTERNKTIYIYSFASYCLPPSTTCQEHEQQLSNLTSISILFLNVSCCSEDFCNTNNETIEQPPYATTSPDYTTRRPTTNPYYTTRGPTTKPSCHRNESCRNYGSCNGFRCNCITGFYGDSCQYKYSWAKRVCASGYSLTIRDNITNQTFIRRFSRFSVCYNSSQTCGKEHIFYNVKNSSRYYNYFSFGCLINSTICEEHKQWIIDNNLHLNILSSSMSCCNFDFCNIGNVSIPSVSGCQSNPCRNDGQCIPSGNGYSCNCGEMFKGRHCETGNYCYFKPCKNGGRCVENPSNADSYLCNCTSGYTGARCEKASCFMDNMYPYGPSETDEEFPSTRLYRWECWQREIPVDIEVDFYGRKHKTIYVCRNGILQFGFFGIAWWPYKFGLRHWYRQFGIIAPFWSLVDMYKSFSNDSFYHQGYSFPPDPNSKSRIYYHAYHGSSGSSILRKATQDVKKYANGRNNEFEAKLVIVVTWVNIYPEQYRQKTPYFELANTFQVVLITDELSTFTMFNYPCGGIQWVVAASGSDWRKYWYDSYGLPVAGWNSGSGNRNKYFNIPGSGTVKTINLSKEKGNTQEVGRWFFPLNDGPTTKSEAELKCKTWYRLQSMISEQLKLDQPCPCSYWQGWRDRRFRWDWLYYYNYAPPNVECFLSHRFFRRHLSFQIPNPINETAMTIDAELSQRCCYSFKSWEDFGWLVEGPRYGGYLRLDLQQKKDWFSSDEDAHQACCGASDLCELFYQRRPSDSCHGYRPPRRRWFWGDPHIVTMDNMNYTFNGLGEYVMADVDNGLFQLQARTKKAAGGDATVFAAGAAKEQQGTIEVRLNETGKLDVLVDGNPFNFSTVTANVTKDISNISISREENDDLSATFPSGITVTFGSVKGMMTIVLSVPQSLKNKTKGLLGVWNDDPDDDFTRPDGSMIPISSNDSTIHYEFGLKWQITANQSLFTYEKGHNVETFKNISYVPLFADELKFHNATLEKQAREVCGSNIACLFDAAATKDASVGAATLGTSNKLVNESTQLENFPPELVNASSTIKLTLNQMATIIVTAEDKNGDSISFRWTLLPGLQATIQGNILTIKWTMTTTDKVNFTVALQDSKGATSVWEPNIILCACQNGGNCSKVTDQSGSRFQVMPCTCSKGYTGKFCESDIDACAIRSPCFPGAQCQDLPPPKGVDGYKCGSCPDGYSGDGATCTDIDECLANPKCSQICINTPGSFRCQCKSGFQLESDGFMCTDINECKKPVCQQFCNNTEGSYACYCNKGFKVDPRNTKLCEPEKACNASIVGCNQVCYVANGEKLCSCYYGYKLGNDNKTCQDIDECAESPCSQTCTNFAGGYNCACRSGFELASDNATCEDINECIGDFNCSDPFQNCINTEGSYICKCESGLELVNGSCKEITYTSSTLAPTTEAVQPPTARQPSKEEIEQSVLMTVKNMRKSEWTATIQQNFKTTVSESVSKYCQANREKCGLTSSRLRRAAEAFSPSEVHLLPSYPKQNGTDLIVAFYVQNPRGNEPVFPAQVLIKVVQGDIDAIEKALGNKTIAGIQRFTTPLASTIRPPLKTWKWIAIGAGAAVGLTFIVIIFTCWFQKNKKKQKTVPLRPGDRSNDGYNEEEHEMGDVH